MVGTPWSEAWALFRMDAARWIEPESISAPELVGPRVAALLLLRHPPLRAMAWFRFGSAAKRRGVRGVAGWVQRRLLRLYGLELTVGATVGGGLYVAHPVGCVLAAESIGENVSVIAQVTLGTRNDRRWPTIGDEVFIGAGAKILGGVHVGSGAKVGANSVVLADVPSHCTVVGLPARLV